MDDKEIPRKTYTELIFEQLKEIKSAMREDKRELQAEISRTREEVLSRLEQVEKRLDRLERRLDRQEDNQSGSTRHSQILTGTTISIALAVIYSILK